MITRQRLGQLIKEEKFIYTTRLGGKKPEKFKLYKDFFMSQEDTLCCLNKSQEFLVCKVKFKYLFETKEEAEWQLEFGNIQRTETLSLPSWEEIFTDKEVCYNGIYNLWWQNNALLYGIHFVCYINNNDFKNGTIQVNNKFFKGITKENYIKACGFAKKLFKGEEV